MNPELIKALLDALTADDPEAIKAAATALLAALAAPGSDTEPPPPEADPLAADAEPPPAKLAALKAVRALTGCTSLGEAVEVLKAWKSDRDADATNAAALEETSRAELVGELVKLGYETPATAWVDAENGKKKPAAHLAALSVPALRSRVAAFKGAPKAPVGHKPPVGGTESVTLSAFDAANAKKAGMTAEQFIAAKKNAVKRA